MLATTVVMCETRSGVHIYTLCTCTWYESNCIDSHTAHVMFTGVFSMHVCTIHVLETSYRLG